MTEDFEHVVIVSPHDVDACHTARLRGGVCGTTWEVNCSCGFGQGTDDEEHAGAIGREHARDPDVSPVDVPYPRPRDTRRVIRIPSTGDI